MPAADFNPDAACVAAGVPFPCCDAAGVGDCGSANTSFHGEGVEFRNGWGGHVANSIFVNTGTAQGHDVVTGTTTAGAAGWETQQNVCADSDGDGFGDVAYVAATTFDDVAAVAGYGAPGFKTGASLTAVAPCLAADGAEEDILQNGDGRFGPGPATGNCVNAAVFSSLADEDITFDPTGDASGRLVPALKLAPTNPRGPTGSCSSGTISPGALPINRPAAYRGAFAPGAAEPLLWTTDWTVLSIGGLLAD
jgi:hypothetical protein